jgi:ElaA protein
MQLNWSLKKFSELAIAELYAVLQLRNEVFVVEQDCPYQDADNKDQKSFHCMGWYNETLVAYTRIIPAGISYTEASIGRVVTHPQYRGNGIGKELMQLSIQHAFDLFGGDRIKIGAQLYLKKFYEALGFIQCSNVYLEDNIPHIEMLLLK